MQLNFFSADEFDELKVFITTTSDVIFFVTYPTIPLHPVQLRLLYREVGSNRNLSVIPATTFANTKEIDYIAFENTVPFDRFQVKIALVHGSLEGPGRDTMLEYGKCGWNINYVCIICTNQSCLQKQ